MYIYVFHAHLVRIGCRVMTARESFHFNYKASDSDLFNYQCSLTHELCAIVLPVEALLCSDLCSS